MLRKRLLEVVGKNGEVGSIHVQMDIRVTCQCRQFLTDRVHHGLTRLRAERSEAFATAQEAAVFKHSEGLRMERPISALARFVRVSRNLDEAIVKAEIVSQRVLPTLRIDPIVRETIGDEFVNITEWQHFFGRTPNGHGRQGNVRIWWLMVAVRLSRGTWHFRARISRF